MADKPILVIGGTRGTGLLIANLLEQRGSPVRVLARTPERAKAAVGPHAEVVYGDITRSETLALEHPRAAKTTFEIVWSGSGPPAPWSVLLEGLQPDTGST